jgi:hypothetical protein
MAPESIELSDNCAKRLKTSKIYERTNAEKLAAKARCHTLEASLHSARFYLKEFEKSLE